MNEFEIRIIKDFYKSLKHHLENDNFLEKGTFCLLTEVKSRRYKNWGKTFLVKNSLKSLLSKRYINHFFFINERKLSLILDPEKFIEYYENNLDPKPKTINN